MTGNNTLLAISSAYLIRNIVEKKFKTDQVYKIPCLSVNLFSCSLCELPLIPRVDRKWKGRAGDNCKRSNLDSISQLVQALR